MNLTPEAKAKLDADRARQAAWQKERRLQKRARRYRRGLRPPTP
jgi:hypothetical protein